MNTTRRAYRATLTRRQYREALAPDALALRRLRRLLTATPSPGTRAAYRALAEVSA